MPMHDWTRVISGIVHDFHQSWIITIRNSLNQGRLPDDYYALVEQKAEGSIPHVLTLERTAPGDEQSSPWAGSSEGGVAVAEHPPCVAYTLEAEMDAYADKASRLAVYHASGDRLVAYVEIVSPGNKHSEANTRKFLDKLAEAMKRGCHLLVIDPHPPTPRDPHGLHFRFWTEYFGQPRSPGVTVEKPLSLAAYRSDLVPNAYFQPLGVGNVLPDMPLFFTPDRYVNVPIEQTYADAWRDVPKRWKHVIEGTTTPSRSDVVGPPDA